VNEATDRLTDERAITEILADWRRRLRNAPDLQPREGVRGQRERSLTRALLVAADAPENSSGATESLGKLAMIAALTGGYQCDGGEAELMKTLPAMITDSVGRSRPTR